MVQKHIKTLLQLGVLWVHNKPIAGSPAVINKLQEIGKKVFFVTNNSTKTQKDFATKSRQLGYNMKEVSLIISNLFANGLIICDHF